MTINILLTIFGFFTALIVSAYSIPVIIKVAFIKKLYDKPGGRKTHKGYVPNLGGIAIFAAFLIAFICWTDFSNSTQLQYFILGLIILHFIGVKDDIVPLNPFKKLIGQITAAAILVIPGKFRITDLYGVLGIHHLPIVVSIILSIFAVIVIVNSFNLIDGIDGLAGGISLVIAVAYSYMFWLHGMHNMLIATMALSGALISFLYYNKQPAKIFMGDAGSMGIGYLMAAFSFQFVNMGNNLSLNLFHNNPAVVIAFLIIPLFDTLRVFTLRILNKRSPFSADCNHIHHKLLDIGFSHRRATFILCTVNILFIGLAYLMKDINPNMFILIIVALAGILTYIPKMIIQRNKRRTAEILLRPTFQVISSSATKQIPISSALPENEVATELHLN